ncbi:MAG TPA: DUF4142 domain-containing protein [Gammaproteobacteria bacterium]|nr:DUF4142 domain-containing protein [Gammaproteobacteria bacterium]
MKAKWILLVAAFALPMAAYASSSSPKVSHQDKVWMKAAHQANLAEIKAGKAAQQKGKNAIVRKTGHMLVSDHTMLDAALKRAAHELDVTLPKSPSPMQQKVLHKAKSMSGSDFDKYWVRSMEMAHLKAINKTNFEIHHARSEQVKKLAKKALPVLQTHLNMLQHAQNEVK